MFETAVANEPSVFEPLFYCMLKSKMICNDQELIPSNSSSFPKTKREKSRHTQLFMKDMHGKSNEELFPKTCGHSATLIENKSNIYFYLFLFQITKQNIIQSRVTILPETTDTLK